MADLVLRKVWRLSWKYTIIHYSCADSDLKARREVNKFMQGRMQAILLDGYTVPGITARYAVQKKLIYHKENDYYE